MAHNPETLKALAKDAGAFDFARVAYAFAAQQDFAQLWSNVIPITKPLDKLTLSECARLIGGYKHRIGGGHYSTVFQSFNPRRVMKIGGGDNWPEYVQWAHALGECGRFAPKVYGMRFLENSDYVALCERLDPLPSEYGRDMDATIGRWGSELESIANWMVRLDTVFPGALAFYRKLHAEYGAHNLDIQTPNLMIRGNQLVFNDPVKERYHGRKPGKWRPW